MFDEAARFLAASAAPTTDRLKALVENDWTETLNDLVGSYVRDHGTRVDALSKADRLGSCAASIG